MSATADPKRTGRSSITPVCFVLLCLLCQPCLADDRYDITMDEIYPGRYRARVKSVQPPLGKYGGIGLVAEQLGQAMLERQAIERQMAYQFQMYQQLQAQQLAAQIQNLPLQERINLAAWLLQTQQMTEQQKVQVSLWIVENSNGCPKCDRLYDPANKFCSQDGTQLVNTKELVWKR